MNMKVLKNYAYNLSYQLLVIILPIVTTPYVTRVFSSNDLGTYGYFNSIVTYFLLLATLGVANYGTIFKRISGGFIPFSWGLRFYPLPSMFFCV